MRMRLEKLSKTYKSRTGSGSFFAVREANVTLEPGQTVGLFGDSGSGNPPWG